QAVGSACNKANEIIFPTYTGGQGGNVALICDGANYAALQTDTSSPLSTGFNNTLKILGSTSGAVGFAAPAAAGSATYTLPSADGANTNQLTTDGAGNLSWAASGSTAFNTLTAATGANSINHATFAQVWQWNSLAANNGLTLSTTSTVGSSTT